MEHAVASELKTILEQKEMPPAKTGMKQQVLGSLRRQRLLEELCNNPGSNFNKIQGRLTWNARTLLWHLNVLVNADIAAVRSLANKRIYYPVQMLRPEDVVLRSLLTKKDIRGIFQLLSKRPALTQDEICRKLMLSPYTCARDLAILKRFGILDSVRDGKYKRYCISTNFVDLRKHYRKREKHFRIYLVKLFQMNALKPEVLRSADGAFHVSLSSCSQSKEFFRFSTNPFDILNP